MCHLWWNYANFIVSLAESFMLKYFLNDKNLFSWMCHGGSILIKYIPRIREKSSFGMKFSSEIGYVSQSMGQEAFCEFGRSCVKWCCEIWVSISTVIEIKFTLILWPFDISCDQEPRLNFSRRLLKSFDGDDKYSSNSHPCLSSQTLN